MALIAKKPSPPSRCCTMTRRVTNTLLFLSAVAALVGVVQTHLLMNEDMMRLQFGSTSASLALLAFVVALMAWVKSIHGCCGNGK